MRDLIISITAGNDQETKCVFTNYGITLPNIYCIILFITVVAFNKSNVRDIHIFPPTLSHPLVIRKQATKLFLA